MNRELSIGIYEIDWDYVQYISQSFPHAFHNKKKNHNNTRKYVGVVLQINDMKYFAPLSSYKDKHKHMKDGLDLIKVKKYAVINLNNMFPVPDTCYHLVDFSKETDQHYRNLLMSEYRFIKMIREKIRKNALLIYNHKLKNDNSTPLAKRCNDFSKMEIICKQYK